MHPHSVIRSRRIAGVALALALTQSFDARASDDQTPSRLRDSSPAEQPAGRAPAQLTRRQLDDFASLVGEEEELVVQRLLRDPGLIPLVAEAADTRRARRRTGMAMTIGGFGLMGVGVLLGGVMVISGITPNHDCPYEGGSTCDSGGNDGEVHTGLLVMLASTAVGLSLGIPGVVRLASPSETERNALERYSNPPARPRLAGRPGRDLVLPLLSLSF